MRRPDWKPDAIETQAVLVVTDKGGVRFIYMPHEAGAKLEQVRALFGAVRVYDITLREDVTERAEVAA